MWFRVQNKQQHLKNQDAAENETTHCTISTYQSCQHQRTDHKWSNECGEWQLNLSCLSVFRLTYPSKI
jgi:hypothetical protein